MSTLADSQPRGTFSRLRNFPGLFTYKLRDDLLLFGILFALFAAYPVPDAETTLILVAVVAGGFAAWRLLGGVLRPMHHDGPRALGRPWAWALQISGQVLMAPVFTRASLQNFENGLSSPMPPLATLAWVATIYWAPMAVLLLPQAARGAEGPNALPPKSRRLAAVAGLLLSPALGFVYVQATLSGDPNLWYAFWIGIIGCFGSVGLLNYLLRRKTRARSPA